MINRVRARSVSVYISIHLSLMICMAKPSEKPNAFCVAQQQAAATFAVRCARARPRIPSLSVRVSVVVAYKTTNSSTSCFRLSRAAERKNKKKNRSVSQKASSMLHTFLFLDPISYTGVTPGPDDYPRRESSPGKPVF